MTFPESISKEKIKLLPLLKFQGKIEVIDVTDNISKICRLLKKEAFLGFDTEKKPTFLKGQYHPTALLQLCTGDHAFLFRLGHIGLHPGIKEILESNDILKIGVSIRDDIIELQQLEDFTSGGFIDLNDEVKNLGIKNIGVRNLTAIFLGHRVSKNQQTSNWENEILTKGQQIYAATDAWVCHEIYNKLKYQGYLD